MRAAVEQETGVPLDGLLTEGLYAHYPNGGYYRRHVDAVPGEREQNQGSVPQVLSI